MWGVNFGVGSEGCVCTEGHGTSFRVKGSSRSVQVTTVLRKRLKGKGVENVLC